MKIEIFEEIDSTNTYLKNLDNKEEYQIAISKIQTAGRGRTGNKWESQMGGAYFSFVFKEKKGIAIEEYTRIPLVVGYSLLKTLENLEKNMSFEFKWTNDIYVQDKKISGILVEKRKEFFIVGIGINLNNKIQGEAEQRGISLGMLTEKEYDREELVKQIVVDFKENLNKYLEGNWKEMLKYLNKKNYLLDKSIEVHLRDGSIKKGICREINETGEIEIELNGRVENFSVGEIHIRKKEEN